MSVTSRVSLSLAEEAAARPAAAAAAPSIPLRALVTVCVVSAELMASETLVATARLMVRPSQAMAARNAENFVIARMPWGTLRVKMVVTSAPK